MPIPSSSPLLPLLCLLLPGLATLAPAALSLSRIGGYATNTFSTGGALPTAAEIPAYDPASKRVFVVNSIPVNGTTYVDVLDLSNPTAPVKVAAIPFGDTQNPLNPNSISIRNGVLAVALGRGVSDGEVRFFSTESSIAALNGGTPLATAPVGAVPDMLTFTPDGKKLLVANEGEPSGYGAGHTDPLGSISIIDVSFPSAGQVSVGTISTAGFESFNVQEAALKAAGVRIFGPGASVAQDLEPEYITISSDSTKAYVTLQENNAIATVDIASGTVTNINPLGTKDHSQPGNGFDGSRTDGINIAQRPVKSFYAPDAITSFEVNGKTYLFTANEGDYRDYAGYAEETTVNGVTLDPAVFPNAAALQNAAAPEGIRNLTITKANGQLNPDGTGDADYEEIIMVGSRSFSTWEANPDGTVSLRFDSGDGLERISETYYSTNFNVTNSSIASDNRSTAKGPEPEGVVVGMVGATPILFVGNERQSNILMYDITDPLNPVFLSTISLRDFTTGITIGNGVGGDIGPEGLFFIPANESPNGEPLLIVTFENSGSTAIFQVVPEAATSLLIMGTALPFLFRRNRRR